MGPDARARRGAPAGPACWSPPPRSPGRPAHLTTLARAVPGAAREQVGLVLRRLVVTPTFAAGLGVVVAATLAATMTKTVLR